MTETRQSLQERFAHETFSCATEDFPPILSLQVINACNARCIMCAYHKIRGNKRPAPMDMELFKKIIDEYVSAGNCKRVGLSLQCESLLDPHLADRISYIKSVSPETTVGISTNAMLLTAEQTARLAAAGLGSLNISLNAITAKSFKAVYQSDTFEQTMQNVQALIDSPPQSIKLSISSMVIRQTLAELFVQKNTIFDKAAAAGIVVVKGPISNHCGNLPEYAQLAVLTGHQGSKQKLYCHDIFEAAYIMSNGDALGCCGDWSRKVLLGNLGSQTFYEIWNLPKTRARKRQMACGLLEAIQPCSGCSQAQNILTNRKLLAEHDIAVDDFINVPFRAGNHD